MPVWLSVGLASCQSLASLACLVLACPSKCTSMLNMYWHSWHNRMNRKVGIMESAEFSTHNLIVYMSRIFAHLYCWQITFLLHYITQCSNMTNIRFHPNAFLCTHGITCGIPTTLVFFSLTTKLKPERVQVLSQTPNSNSPRFIAAKQTEQYRQQWEWTEGIF